MLCCPLLNSGGGESALQRDVLYASHITCYMAGDTRVTSTNSTLFPLHNGKLTLEHTFSFENMLLGRFHEAFIAYEGTDADV